MNRRTLHRNQLSGTGTITELEINAANDKALADQIEQNQDVRIS